MKSKRSSALLLLLWLAISPMFSQSLPEGYPQTEREKTCINAGWYFHLGDPEAGFFTADLDDADWEKVNLPHSLELTSLDLNGFQDTKMQETFQREVGWYRKTIQV